MKQNIISKIMAFALMGLLVSVPMAFAANHSQDRALNSDVGVEMRFEQLKARLEARVDNAEYIASRIDDENASQELLSVIDNFKALHERLNESEAPKEAEDFVAYVHEVTDLTRDFREVATPHISDDIRTELEDRIQDTRQSALDNRGQEIAELKRGYNAEVVSRNVGNVSGLNIEDVVTDFRNGSIDVEDMRSQINQRVRELNPQQRSEIRSQVVENRNKIGIESRERAQEIAESAQERRNEIRNSVEQRVQEIRESQGAQNIPENRGGR